MSGMLDNEARVSLPSFFEILHIRFVEQLGEEAGWYLYHLKLDLQTNGLIRVEYPKAKRNIIPVIKKGRRKRVEGPTMS
jgi:hypothetical protein